jgi:hypothetical protein
MAAEREASNWKPTAVEVRTPARLHLGMLSFGTPAMRSFGGVGVMVDRPAVHVRLRRGDAFRARGPLAERTLEFAQACMQSWSLPPQSACEIEVLATPRSHVGLGSGTQLALAGCGISFASEPTKAPTNSRFIPPKVSGSSTRRMRWNWRRPWAAAVGRAWVSTASAAVD